MFRKWLFLSAILASLPLAVGAVNPVDECETGLVTTRYYGAFLKGIGLGALGDAEPAIAAASERPTNPLADLRATIGNTIVRQALESMVHNPEVARTWAQTRTLLQKLQRERQKNEAVRSEAAENTREVLAPREYLKFKTRYLSVSPMTLEDGRNVIAHFVGKDRIAVTDLATRNDIFTRICRMSSSEPATRT